eukprot:14866972-Ditylum_brightwellii.AAC.1
MHCMGDLPTAQKTWPEWEIFFTKVVQDHRRLQRSAGTNYRANSKVNDVLQQDTIDALANLVLATADDRNAVANLTLSNATLALQIKQLTETATKQKEEMNKMKANIADILSPLQDANLRGGRANSHNRAGHRGCGGSQNRTQPCQCFQPRVYYCLSHGVTGGNHHTSANFEERKHHHRKNATALNCMGGSTEGLE